MIVAVDVQYDEVKSEGRAAAVVFEQWTDRAPIAEYTTLISPIEPYIPGEFFRRELPCLTAVIHHIAEQVDSIVIDGYVRLNDKPGLGKHLFTSLSKRIPVIGVAKTRFHGATAMEVFRGSRSPLYVTAIGADLAEAARRVQAMHGPHRVPTLLKRVDQLARGR